MDYSKTLNLPQTEFPMRGNLPESVAALLDYWGEKDIYEKRATQASLDLFCMTGHRTPTVTSISVSTE